MVPSDGTFETFCRRYALVHELLESFTIVSMQTVQSVGMIVPRCGDFTFAPHHGSGACRATTKSRYPSAQKAQLHCIPDHSADVLQQGG